MTAIRHRRSNAASVADRRDPWWEHAACLGHDPALWSRITYTHEQVDAYGNDQRQRDPRRARYHSPGCTLCVAVTICRKGCPVRRECLDDTMAWEMGKGESSRDGIYGGLTPQQRWRRSKSKAETEEKIA